MKCQCNYCGVQIERRLGEYQYCSDCALELNLAYEPDISQIPDKIEPIVAYRAWNVKDNRLTAVVKSATFKPYQRNEAVCYNNCWYIPPSENCNCGFYAYKEFNQSLFTGEIFGEVYLWGKIIPHKLGYRAQYCYPKRLYTFKNDTKINQEIAQTYGIKTIEFKQATDVKYCDSLDDYSQHIYKIPSLREEDNAIILTSYIAKPRCNICNSTDKCYTDERNYYFYCVKCLNNRIKQRHIETYQNALNHIRNQQLDANKMQIPNPFKIVGY